MVNAPGYIKTPIFETSKMIRLDRQRVMEALPERLGITPEECAQRVLRGVARNRAIIVVTGLAKILWAIHRISPALTFLLMKRHLRDSRETMRIEE